MKKFTPSAILVAKGYRLNTEKYCLKIFSRTFNRVPVYYLLKGNNYVWRSKVTSAKCSKCSAVYFSTHLVLKDSI